VKDLLTLAHSLFEYKHVDIGSGSQPANDVISQSVYDPSGVFNR